MEQGNPVMFLWQDTTRGLILIEGVFNKIMAKLDGDDRPTVGMCDSGAFHYKLPMTEIFPSSTAVKTDCMKVIEKQKKPISKEKIKQILKKE